MQIPFNSIETDPYNLWNSGEYYYNLPANTKWEIGVTLTTLGKPAGPIAIHIIDINNFKIVKSGIFMPSDQLEESWSVDTIFYNQSVDPVPIAVILEHANDITVLSQNFGFSSNFNMFARVSYYWVHEIV